jgi:hypothetical protein
MKTVLFCGGRGRRIRDVSARPVITQDDVVLPAGRLADRLRGEQYRKFRGETWLKDLLAASQLTDRTKQYAVAAGVQNRSNWPASLLHN